MVANRQQRRLAQRICRKEGHLFKNGMLFCARCGKRKKED